MSDCPLSSLERDWVVDIGRVFAEPTRSTDSMNTATRKGFRSHGSNLVSTVYKAISQQRVVTRSQKIYDRAA